jgi:dTDP-4-dehydrorhamnose reductase
MTLGRFSPLYDLPKRRYVLLLGAGGQLGQECAAQLAKQGILLFSPPRYELDLTGLSPLLQAIKVHPLAALINAVAFTDVDGAETLCAEVRQINADAPDFWADVAADIGGRFIHISTDFVFSGEGTTPFSEIGKTGPVNWSGATKRADKLARGDQISAVNDRYGSPMSAVMLAVHIARICARMVRGNGVEAGIFHCAGIGAAIPEGKIA